MIKILPIVGLVLVTVGFIIWKIFFGSQVYPLTLPTNFSIDNNGNQTATSSTSLEGEQSSLAERVKELEFNVTDLLEKIKNPAVTSDSQIKTLQTSIDDLKTRVLKLESPSSSSTTTTSSTTTATSTGAKIAYIPIGYAGSGNSSSDFSNVTGHEATIDIGNYPGYKSMTLEVNFRIFQNGTAQVRFFNKTDGTALLNSVISTTATDYATKSSSSFTIASGSKVYTVQAKSTTGYSVDLQWSRIRVDF